MSPTDPRGLLDTSTAILLVSIPDPESLPEQPLISTITLAELSVGPLVVDDAEERASRQAHLQEAETTFESRSFDAPAARVFGRVAASLRRSGRKPTARSYDALIASVAIANDLPLYTCNPGDFDGIDELRLVSVPHPDAA
ncbi:MAG: type II toxin-antitoxin system VapC family toxin [Acidimicrobiales bacterium]